jgi:hypothetical protein
LSWLDKHCYMYDMQLSTKTGDFWDYWHWFSLTGRRSRVFDFVSTFNLLLYLTKIQGLNCYASYYWLLYMLGVFVFFNYTNLVKYKVVKRHYEASIFQIKTISDTSLLKVCACIPNCNKRGLIMLHKMEVIRLFCKLLNCSSKI